MQKHSVLFITLFFSLSFMLTGCGDNNSSKKPEDVTKKKKFAIPVITSKLKPHSISLTYHSTATLETRHDAQVISRVTGIIEELNVEEGDYVEKGQLLAKIDSRRYKLSLDKAQAELASLNLELSRLKKLQQRNLVSHDQIDKLTYSLESAKAARDLAALDLADSQVKAPISGYIATKMAKKGHFSQSFQQLLYIVNQQDLQAILYVPEAQLANVKLNQIASLSFSALPNKEFKAYVRSISPMIDNNSGTFKVILSLTNEFSILKPGMFAQVSLIFDTHNEALTLPTDAIITRDGQQYIFAVKNNKAHEIAIDTGYTEEQTTEILTALPLDTSIVVQGHRNLKHKALVEIINKKSSVPSQSTVVTTH